MNQADKQPSGPGHTASAWPLLVIVPPDSHIVHVDHTAQAILAALLVAYAAWRRRTDPPSPGWDRPGRSHPATAPRCQDPAPVHRIRDETAATGPDS
ncbi:hypothetical protein [Kitasatospora sp. NBC_01266]|uniref:hypothetical protein n=1 Tax=Kitasatospora sp. NBC_01266 TaxID=2903572 RepID=UPI002E309FB0|nr:hypothetical protein [Kitasatospora sp. NBC_01266]